MDMRKRIYEIIEISNEEKPINAAYDGFMMFIITLSIIPLMFKKGHRFFPTISTIVTVVFIIDYWLRLLTADYKLKKGWASFFLYPFTPSAIIDFLSILPFLSGVHKTFKLLRLLRFLQAFRLLRLVKALRYSKTFRLMKDVLENSKDSLLVIQSIVVSYVFVSALLVFNLEPKTFKNFFEAMYWSMISLTTIGYGDICPVTTVGRLVAMVSSFLGVAIVALPTSVITAGYMEAIKKEEKQEEDMME